MSDVEFEVLRAQQAHAAALEKQKQEQAAGTKKKLVDIRAGKHQRLAELDKESTRIQKRAAAETALREQLSAANAALSENWSRRPACASYLTADEDAEVGRWYSAHNKLDGVRSAILTELNNLPVIDRVAVARLQAEIQRLEYAEQSCLRELERLTAPRIKSWANAVS